MTVPYAAADVAGYDEETITLNCWDGSRWVHAACGPYERHPDENWLVVPVCELNEFALIVEDLLVIVEPPFYQAYLLVVVKD